MFETHICAIKERILNSPDTNAFRIIRCYTDELSSDDCKEIIDIVGGSEFCFKNFNTTYLFEDCQEGTDVKDVQDYINRGIVMKILSKELLKK